MRKKISEANAVTITLTGVELVAFMAKACGRGDTLSLEGALAYKRAADKIEVQLTEQGYLS